MAQYKHDRFFKFYVQALYKTKGETRKNIKVMNDEELEIDCMFSAQSDKVWLATGGFRTIRSLDEKVPDDYQSSITVGILIRRISTFRLTRKNLYWEPKETELIEAARVELQLKKSAAVTTRMSKAQIEIQNPFTWVLAVNCGDKLLKLCEAKPLAEYGEGVYELSKFLRMGIVVIDRLSDGKSRYFMVEDVGGQGFGAEGVWGDRAVIAK